MARHVAMSVIAVLMASVVLVPMAGSPAFAAVKKADATLQKTNAPAAPVTATATTIESVNVRAGQTFVTFDLAKQTVAPETVDTLKLGDLLKRMDAEKRDKNQKYYVLYRSENGGDWKRITMVDGFSAFNVNVFGRLDRKNANQMNKTAIRYVLEDGDFRVDAAQGFMVHTPMVSSEVESQYLVVAVGLLDRNKVLPEEALDNLAVGKAASVKELPPSDSSFGVGRPVLQRVEYPGWFNGVTNPELYYYTRWETGRNTSLQNRACDYVVGINRKVIDEKNIQKAPLGVHLHAYGGNLEMGYGDWADWTDGAVLLATNQDPYDWWTAHHEAMTTSDPLKNKADYAKGVVRPFTENRILSMVAWMKAEGPYPVDPAEVFTAGASMGGSGSLMLAYRHPEVFAWNRSWVGVHDPKTSNIKGSYAKVYGPPEVGAVMENGESPWDYYSDIKWLYRNKLRDMPFTVVSNGRNDELIGWSQAVNFAKALQDNKQPHVFQWGMDGHNQRVFYPMRKSINQNPMVTRLDVSLPAFTDCSLDDDPGDGTPDRGKLAGQINGYLYWDGTKVVDEEMKWAMPIGLINEAPSDTCTTDVTPRRLQKFRIETGATYAWRVEVPLSDEEIWAASSTMERPTTKVLASGTCNVGSDGLLTVEDVPLKKGLQTLIIEKR